MKKSKSMWMGLLAIAVIFIPSAFSGGTAFAATGDNVLFDQGHGQTAGNADWTVDGGYSSFADAIMNDGYDVYYTSQNITSSMLSGMDVLVLPEPNIKYTSSEEQAINTFVYNGGSVYFISDHNNSDRNNDGWDSVRIFNDFVSGYGISFDKNWTSQDPVNDLASNSITQGVSAIGCWGGTTIHINGNNASGDAYLNSYSDPFALHGTYGYGRFAALGDSSPYDDGSGRSGASLYPNWFDYDDSTFGLHTIEWLAGDR